MTDLEFQFWQAAFLAAMQGMMASPNVNLTAPLSVLADNALRVADAALAVWREKRRELHMPENGGKGCQ